MDCYYVEHSFIRHTLENKTKTWITESKTTHIYRENSLIYDDNRVLKEADIWLYDLEENDTRITINAIDYGTNHGIFPRIMFYILLIWSIVSLIHIPFGIKQKWNVEWVKKKE